MMVNVMLVQAAQVRLPEEKKQSAVAICWNEKFTSAWRNKKHHISEITTTVNF
jgi:hypothetical protein